MPMSAFAQSSTSTPGANLLFRPHCEGEAPITEIEIAPSASQFLSQGRGTCKNFSMRDPQTLQTSALKAGDILDLDVIVYNPNKTPLKNVRAWISYDPQTLEGVSISLKDLAVPTPGEVDFSASEGFAKINATAETGQTTSPWLVNIARVQFKVLRAPLAGLTPIGFYDLQSGNDGHTKVIGNINGEEKNVLPGELGSLVVVISPTTSITSASSAAMSLPVSSIASSSAASSLSSTGIVSSMGASSTSSSVSSGRTTFVLLQIQNLRATTEGGAIYLAWDKLPSGEVVGYNVYYGTEKGRYIQRKSVTPENSTHIIRGLPENTVYYVAVRAFNSANEETAFSREVMIKTGDPRSSTAPLSLDPSDHTMPDGNPLTGSLTGVPGASGMPSLFVTLLIVCAITGTLFAFRRQIRIQKPSKKQTHA